MMFVQLNPSPMAVGEIGPIESSCYGRGKRTRAGDPLFSRLLFPSFFAKCVNPGYPVLRKNPIL